MERCEKMLEYLINTVNRGESSTFPKSTEQVNSEFIINGKNVMRLPATGLYNFAFKLLDMMFTKEELSNSLLYKAKRSDRSALDSEKVERLIYLVNERYGARDGWDEKTFITKLNQKCRDSGARRIKDETD